MVANILEFDFLLCYLLWNALHMLNFSGMLSFVCEVVKTIDRFGEGEVQIT